MYLFFILGFPGSSAGKESACNAGDPGSIPGSGRSAGGGIDYPLQNSCASLVALLVKNSPAMQETWVRSLSQKDRLKKETATHSSTLAWKILWTEEPGRLQTMRSKRISHDWATKQTTMKNTGLVGPSLLQGIFPTQESNQGLLHCRQILYQLSCQGGS